jgi:hypothetical protein
MIVLKRKLDTQLKRIKRDIRELEGPFIDEMVTEGVPRFTVNLDSGETVTLTPSSIERCGVATDYTKEQVAMAMLDNGLGDMVKQDFNLNTLSAAMREARGDDSDLPVGVLTLLEVRTDLSMKATIS